jgi:ketosteroid isomerase-like protein
MPVAALFALALSAAPAAPATPAMSAEECAVWRREASFAASVDRHDREAFLAHLHPGTVFDVGSPAPQRGRDAVLAAWAPLIAGEPVQLRWFPEVVHIGGEPDIASSHGPYLLRRTGADGQPEYALGRFQSVWKKAADGQWYVLFDGGAPPPRPVGREAAEAAEAALAALPRDCPHDGGSDDR